MGAVELVEHVSPREFGPGPPPTTDDPPVEPRRGRGRSGWHVLESLAVFAIGVGLMSFIYAGDADRPVGERGVPGHDSFYHVKMATLIPEHGLVDEFPWLRFVYFTEEGHAFVEHHYGFHVLLIPFVHLSHWLTGDYLAGGRWAMVTFFGLGLMLFNLLLIGEEVRWRWFWLMVFLLLPFQFFTRHAYVRAINPSLVFMLLILLLMFRRRFLLTGVVVAGYTHLYLGGVLYAPLLVGLYVLSGLVGPRPERAIPWRLIVCGVVGWTVGVLTYPYAGGTWEFLKLQVFGSGLSPDISVGREWKPYQNLWWFAQMSGTILIVWAVAVAARLQTGKPLNAKELTLLVANFAFLALTCKARRFIEYWPMFCLLSAAFLARPVLDGVGQRLDTFRTKAPGQAVWLGWAVILPVAAGLIALVYRVGHWPSFAPFLAEWPMWTALAALYLLIPLSKVWVPRGGTEGGGPARVLTVAMVPLSGAVFVGVVIVLVWWGFGGHIGQPARLGPGYPGWIGLAVLYVIVAGLSLRRGHAEPAIGWPTRCAATLRALVAGVAFLAATVSFAGYPLSEVQRKARCGYDLPAIRDAMAFLEEHSPPGDVVFTDDWDIFPVYFYFNSHNHYIVGLDPKFTQARRPVLWERYVKVSRGQVPADVTVEVPDESENPVKRKIHVQLEDIRDHFGAGYVITDRDHQNLARKLARAEDFAELIYPSASYETSRDAPYLIFRVRGETVDNTDEDSPGWADPQSDLGSSGE